MLRLREGWVYGWLMEFNAPFNTISDTSLRSVLLVEEAGVPGENHRVISFIGGGNWSTRRKPSTSVKSLTNFIT